MLTLSFNVVNSHKSMDKKMKNKELLDELYANVFFLKKVCANVLNIYLCPAIEGNVFCFYKCSKFIVSVLKEANRPLFLFRALIF